MLIRRWLLAGLALLAGLSAAVEAAAFEPFVVQEIRVEGVQRIAEGTVFSYLPVEPGDRVGPREARAAIRELYLTGFFRDIELRRDDDTLVVVVRERPSIARLEFFGNEQIRTEDLREALAAVGFAEGQIFNRPQLAEIERELRQQYFNQGKYDVSVESTVSPLARNRVAIRVDIDEGPVAAIREIHFVGNEAFTDRRLRGVFDQRHRRWWAPWSHRHRYSRDMLANDLESLRGHYMDRGYINFVVRSTQVSISPDRRDVFVTVAVDEGEPYTVSRVSLRGDLIVPAEELMGLMQVEEGALYSRARVNASIQAIQDRLGDDGYAFARVQVHPEIDDDENTVALAFFVDPGIRVYVRRINITGNLRTQDEVIRREMRQMELAPLSSAALRQSRVRLNRLGFFDFVDVDTVRVPGTEDQVDVNVAVSERMTGELQAGIGYGDVQGWLINFSVSQDNLLGTGDRLSMVANSSTVSNWYDLSYTDRYHTMEGVSRTLAAGYRETRARRADLADYDLTTGHLSVEYGIPVTEVDRVHARVRYERMEIFKRGGTPPRLLEFLEREGSRFTMVKPRLAWSRDTRNRAIFATSGARQQFSLEGTLPDADLEFYKTEYEQRRYWPLGERTAIALEGRLSYGDGYGETERLPFFEHYYAGGVRTVRGYRGNYLGPRDPQDAGRPMGGNARVLTRAEVVFPPTAEAQSVRLQVFVDAGQVYDTHLDYEESDAFPEGLDRVNLSEMRAAAGIGLVWMSPVGPLTFSFSEPLNATDEDRTEIFQFSLGTFF